MKRYRRFVHWLAHPRLPNEHGYAMAFWAIFLGTVMVPLMVLAWDVGRLFYARGEIQKAADAAALAAAREGVDTMLVERYGCFGGNITQAMVERSRGTAGRIRLFP